MHQSGNDQRNACGSIPATRPTELRGPLVAGRLADIERATPIRPLLVRRAQSGEPGAQRALYDAHFAHVYAYLLEALKHHEDAEDACQHVFLKVFATLPTYNPDGEPFQAWLFTLVRNHAIDRLRSAGRNRTTATDPHDLNRTRTRLEASLAPTLDRRGPHVESALANLPRPQRQTIALLYTHDLPATEAAIVLGRTPNAVRLLHRRALTTLAANVARSEPSAPAA